MIFLFGNKVRIEYFLLFIVAFLVVALSKDVYMINQGDFGRLTSGFIDISKYSRDSLSFQFLEHFNGIFSYSYKSSFSYVVYIYALFMSYMTNIFDLQFFAALMRFVFIFSLYALFKSVSRNSVCDILIFTVCLIPIISTSNLSVFASFYQDQIILPLIPLALAFAIKSDKKSIIITFISLTLISSTKSQYFYIPIVFIIYYSMFNRNKLKLKIYLSLISLLIATCAIIFSSGASQFNKYHSNYFGSLVYMKNNNYPIPQKYNPECIGVDAWGNILNINTGATPSEIGTACLEKNAFYGFKDSLKELIKHPSFIFKLPFENTMISLYGENYFHVYKSYKLIQCNNSLLCELPAIKDMLFNKVRFPALLLCMILSLIFVKRQTSGIIFIASSIGVSQLYISFIGEGYRDINKHLIGMNYSFDIILFIIMGIALTWVMRKR